MTETAINYFLVELDRMLKDLEFFSKQQGISLGAAKKANEIHKEIIELIRPFSTEKLSVENPQEQQYELRTLRDENRKLRNTLEMDRKDCDRYRSALVEIINLSSLSPTINDIARKVLAGLDIEGGCPVGPIGVNGLTKEELEGSGDE